MFLISHLIEQSRYMNFCGIAVILLTAFLFSRNKKKINPLFIAKALALQFFLAFFILRTGLGKNVFQGLARIFQTLYTFADAGGQFIFGSLSDPTGSWGMIFAVKVIPIIIFFGAFTSMLFHLGVVQWLVKIIAFLIRPILGSSGAETLCAVANSMLGQTEAPLLIKRYLSRMTQSEILVVMISGFSTLSGAILAVYASMGVPILHLLSASVMSIPGSLLIAKILIPETAKPETVGGKSVHMKSDSANLLDAISQGTSDGLQLAVNVAAMLIAFISLMACINYLLVATVGYSLDYMFAKVFYFAALLIGIPAADRELAGIVLGQKLVINEFVAYAHFVTMDLAPRSKEILTYALAGFANFSCIGIQIGGIGALAPEKRTTLTRLGMIGLLGGTLTNFLNAAIAGLFI